MIDDVMRELERDAAPDAAAQVIGLATEYFDATRGGDGPVSTGVAPNDVAARFDEPMPERGRPLAEVVARVRSEIIADANRLAHPMYMGHQVSFPLPMAAWTDAVISSLNQSVAVEEMSPTLTSLEHRVIRWMCDAAGFPGGSGGTFTSGGTEATFSALLAARAAALPDSWMNGITEPRPVVLCGEHTHYAVTRAVAELGLGMRSAVIVPSVDYRMDDGAEARARPAAHGRSASDGRGRNGEPHGDGRVRRHRCNRPALRVTRHLAAHRRGARCDRPSFGPPPASRPWDRARAVHRVGSA
jgi:L-2,4-diaminobutyrate decarboxylase